MFLYNISLNSGAFNFVATSWRYCWPLITFKACCKGNNGKNWLLSPGTTSQSEGYSSKWLIWPCREPLKLKTHPTLCMVLTNNIGMFKSHSLKMNTVPHGQLGSLTMIIIQVGAYLRHRCCVGEWSKNRWIIIVVCGRDCQGHITGRERKKFLNVLIFVYLNICSVRPKLLTVCWILSSYNCTIIINYVVFTRSWLQGHRLLFSLSVSC